MFLQDKLNHTVIYLEYFVNGGMRGFHEYSTFFSDVVNLQKMSSSVFVKLYRNNRIII